jgi:tetratricopeptide (TPR) repeat protein
MTKTISLSVLVLASVALARDPTAGRTDFAAGLAALAQRDFGAAEQQFRAVLAANPASYEAHNNLAVAYAEQGRLDVAVAELREALQLRPDYERSRQNLAALYVRLAAKELLTGAEHAEGPKRQALAAKAREVLMAGPHLPPAELLARADELAGWSGTPAPKQPSGAKTAAGAAPPSATAPPTPTATVTPAAPRAQPTHAAVAAQRLPAAIAPVGAQVLVIDPRKRAAVLYRRNSSELDRVGSWQIELRGQVSEASLLGVVRRSNWSVRLFDLNAQHAAGWAIESGSKVQKGSNAIVLDASDFHVATGQLTPHRDFVAVIPDAPALTLDTALADQLRQRVETWRQVWERRDLAAYGSMYVPGFVDSRHRPKEAWLARKKQIFDRSGEIKIDVRNMTVIALAGDAATTFDQDYRSALMKSLARKQLLWRKVNATWLIAAEDAMDESSSPSTDE